MLSLASRNFFKQPKASLHVCLCSCVILFIRAALSRFHRVSVQTTKQSLKNSEHRAFSALPIERMDGALPIAAFNGGFRSCTWNS